MKLTVGSLFSGIDGLGLGLEKSGFQIKWQVEYEKYCRAILGNRFPESMQFIDACEFPPPCQSPWLLHRWKQRYEVDLICGGDPCQENSNARQRTGLSQKSLGGQFIRIINILRPRFVLRENPSAVRSDAPWPWFRFRSALESIGYIAVPFRLRSCCFGKDHKRERLFLFAVRADSMCAGLERNVFEEMERAYRQEKIRNTARQNRRNTTPRICRAVDGISNRVERIKAGGNAVDVDVSEYIGRQIIESIPKGCM